MTYFEYLVSFFEDLGLPDCISRTKLFEHLNNTPFLAILPQDENRMEDGQAVRWSYDWYNTTNGVKSNESGRTDDPCTILELLVYLSQKTEEYMTNPLYGDRTRQWSNLMLKSLGLYKYYNNKYNKKEIDDIIHNFIYRLYAPNGKGGLFTVRDTLVDMREIGIWKQLNLYFSENN